MGNNICQCKIICQNIKDTDLSSSKNLAHLKKLKDPEKDFCDLFENNDDIKRIYINNCVKKIARVYLIYKKRKNKNKKNGNKNINIYNNELSNIIIAEDHNNNNDLQIDSFDNIMDYSMTHLYNKNKVNTKTNYKKFDIPKINNGKSLEMLLS